MNGSIFIYSGGSFLSNRRLDNLLLKDKENPTIIYIPTSIHDKKIFYKNYKTHIKKISKNANVIYYPLELFSEESFVNIIKEADIIYFAGGNTFDLLKNLHSTKIKKYLTHFLKKDKIIACESAGAICLSANINMASIPKSTADENKNCYNSNKGLNLFSFEVCPHFNKKFLHEIKQYQELNKSIIYGIYDGSGIVIDKDKKIKLIGKVVLI